MIQVRRPLPANVRKAGSAVGNKAADYSHVGESAAGGRSANLPSSWSRGGLWRRNLSRVLDLSGELLSVSPGQKNPV